MRYHLAAISALFLFATNSKANLFTSLAKKWHQVQIVQQHPENRPEATHCEALHTAIYKGLVRSFSQNETCPDNQLRFWSLSGIPQNSKPLIQDLLDLPSGEPIPAEIIKKYDSRLIARTLVQKKYRERLNDLEFFDQTNNSDFDFYSRTQIQLTFNSKIFHLIAKNGILNQFQTGSSSVNYSPNKRREVENHMLGHSFENETHDKELDDIVFKVRPKYAHLVTYDKKYFDTNQYSSNYGNVIAVLKNDVKSRALLTNGDSLNVYNNFGPQTLSPLSFHYLTPQKPFPILDIKSVFYYEAQVYGELTLEDVEYLMVNCYWDYPIPDLKEKFLPLVKKLSPKLKVYSCTDGENYSFVPTERLL